MWTFILKHQNPFPGVSVWMVFVMVWASGSESAQHECLSAVNTYSCALRISWIV